MTKRQRSRMGPELRRKFREAARGVPPCDFATHGDRIKTACGKCRQRWLCSNPKVSKIMPRGGWPDRHCRSMCKFKEEGNRKMRIASVITARNEGVEVQKTAESLADSVKGADLHIIIIDDGSTDKSCEGLAANIEVVRHDQSQGVGVSRNFGCDIALKKGADVVTFHDAHMRFPDGVIEGLATKAVESDAMVCSKAKGWWDKDGKPHSFVAWGTDLHWNLRDGFQPKYRVYAGKGEEWQRVPGMMGACYVFSRATIARLKESTSRLWEDVAGVWGFSEDALAVKAFLLGIPTLVSRDLPTHHHYRSSNPAGAKAAGDGKWMNITFAMAALFSEEMFDERFRGYCEKRLPKEMVAKLVAQGREGVKRSWPVANERKVFTHLCGRNAQISQPHPDHEWLFAKGKRVGLIPNAQAAADGLDHPIRILQWRPGESTLLLKRHFDAAKITCLEWVGHRTQNWRATLGRLKDVKLCQMDLMAWTDPVISGHVKATDKFDVITVGGEMQEECIRAAQRLLAKGGTIVCNPTMDRFQIEDAERRAADKRLEMVATQRNIKAIHTDAPPSVTVLLLNWRRPENIGGLLDCLSKQTLKPKVWLWDNGVGEQGPIQLRTKDGIAGIETHPLVERVVRPSDNWGCIPRWWIASMTDTEYICSLDDDLLLKDHGVLWDAIEAQRKLCPKGIVGFFGWQAAEGRGYKGARHINGSNSDQRVDLIKGRFMCFKRTLLEHVPLVHPALNGQMSFVKRCDDIYVNLCISKAKPGAHLVPGVLGKRFRQHGKVDGRALETDPGHYRERGKLIEILINYYKESA